jgi:hypothetical protein
MSDEVLLALAVALQATGYSFTTVTPATHARVNSRLNAVWARSATDVFGWSRPFREGVLTPQLFAAMRNADVLDTYGEGWISRVRASTLRGLLFLHSAYPTTASDAVFFGPDTYRFANAIARYLAGDLRYTAVNARLAGAIRVVAHHSDLLDGVDGDFDLIVANPPYLIDAQERSYRHGGGRLGEGLSLAIVSLAKTRLVPGGALLLYTGTAIIDGTDRFLASVAPILDESSFEWDYQELDPDVFGEELAEPAYADADRIAAVLLTARKGTA